MKLGVCGIDKIENKIINSFKRGNRVNTDSNIVNVNTFKNKQPTKTTLLLNILNLDFNYALLEQVDKLYVPLIYFGDNKYKNILEYLSKNFNLYIYMPTIIRKHYMVVAKSILKKSFERFNIKGIVISNLSQAELLKDFKNIDIIANYTLNIYNNYSIKHLSELNINSITISPELDEEGILSICNNTGSLKELIVYGNIPVMTTSYCPLGKSNKCYKGCSKKCEKNSKFYLKDRMNMLFRMIPDSSQTISTIYNSKTTSIEYQNFNIDFARIDILDEDIEQINNIIKTVKTGNRFEGKNYTNGNLKRKI